MRDGLALDATLVTDNLREFEGVDGLKLDNWLRFSTTGYHQGRHLEADVVPCGKP